MPLGDVLPDAQTYLGSTYVSQFNKFGRMFQIYVQADAVRLEPETI